MTSYLQRKKLSTPVKYRRKSSLWLAAVCVALMLPFSGLKAQSLSGTYTICAKGCDYSTLKGAISDLTSNGVSGKVTFNVAAEQFNEQLSISSAIKGASATNTITFNGAGAWSTSKGTYVYYSNAAPLSLSNTSYIRVQNILFENTGSSSYGGYLNYATYCRFNNVQFKVAASTSSGLYSLYEYYSNNIYFNKCRFSGGYYGVYRYFSSSGATNDTMKNCNITQYYQYGQYIYYGKNNYFGYNSVDTGYSGGYTPFYNFYEKEGVIEYNQAGLYNGSYSYLTYFSESMKIRNNKIGAGSYNYTYLYYGTGDEIYNNKFYGYYYGIMLQYPQYNGQSKPYLFYNNFCAAQNYYGMYIYDYNSYSNINVHILHNTAYTAGSDYGCYLYNESSHGWDLRNNNFYASSQAALYMYNINSTDRLSGNNYYTSGRTLAIIGSGTYTNFADLVKGLNAIGQGQNANNVQTTFVNAPVDLHYSSSTAVPAGKAITSKNDPVQITTDIDGDKRCTIFATSGADEAKPSTVKPTSSYTAPKVLIDGYPAIFKNNAKSTDPFAYRWYVNGKFVSDSFDLLTYNHKTPSSTITLVTEGCSGKDSVTNTYTVSAPSKAPITDFIADRNSIRAGEVVKFSDLSPNFPSKWSWEISPKAYTLYGTKIPTYSYMAGDSTKPFPQIRFDYPGKYKVCLTTSNAKGSGGTECKTDYIEVLGSYTMSNKLVINETKGYLYDDGGPNATYQSYTNTSALIDPGCAKTLYLVFNKFDINCGESYIRIWDGSDPKGTELTPCITNTQYGYGPGLTGGPSSACYQSGIECIPTVKDTFIATSGKMYITMQANWNNNMPGFEAYFWSDPKPQTRPTAGFTSRDTVCTNESVDFINTSKGDDLKYLWDLDGDLSYFEATSLNTDWPYIFPGDYEVTLVTYNCAYSDTFRKTIHVANPPIAKAAFHADNLNPTTNDVVFLMSDVEECVDEYKWRVTKKYGANKVTFVNNSSASKVAQVMLGDTGCYNVSLTVSNGKGQDSAFKSCYIFVKNPYCVPSVDNKIADLGISEVTLHTLNNKSGQSGGYENYTATASTILEIGVSYPFEVSRTTTANKAIRAIYIDWNADGDFNDSLERIKVEKTAGRNLSWIDTLTVPPFAKIGATIMRVAITQGALSNDPCSNSFGEYEDYRIYISNDLTPPVITVLGADTIKLEQGHSFTDPGATAYDNLSGNITSRIKVDNSGFSILNPGTYVFTYNVKDDAGNAAKSKKRVVIVEPDATAPDLIVDASDTVIYVGVFTKFTQPTASAWDLVDGDLTQDITVDNKVNVNVVDTYTVTYQVADYYKNTSIHKITVIVRDTTAPVLRLVGSPTVYVDVNSSYSDSGVSYIDNYYVGPDWNDLMLDRIVTTSTVDITKVGTYTVSYDLTDLSGNAAKTVVRTVIVQDTVAPVVSLVGNATVKLGVFDVFVDPGINVTDNYYKTLTMDTAGDFYTNFADGRATKLGKFTVIYGFEDGSGNKSTIIRYVDVVDTVAPTISLLGSPTVNVCRWSNYNDSNFTRFMLNDNYWTGSNITVETEGNFLPDLTSKPGIYSLRYKATDGSGNVSYSGWRTINILDASFGDCVTGIVDNKELARYFNVYPNPSSGRFVISSNLTSEKAVRISVMNMLGQEVLVKNNQVMGTGQVQLDLSNQPSGVYFLNIYTNDQVITKRIEISK